MACSTISKGELGGKKELDFQDVMHPKRLLLYIAAVCATFKKLAAKGVSKPELILYSLQAPHFQNTR